VPRHRQVVQQVPGLEVVQPVDDEIHAVDEALGVAMVEVVHVRLDVDLPVDQLQPLPGGFGLGHGLLHVPLVVEHLALEVRDLHDVAVDEAQATHAGPGQGVGDDRPQGAAPDDEHPGRPQPPLPRLPDAWQQHLAVVSIKR
jgi:hypothetical protein